MRPIAYALAILAATGFVWGSMQSRAHAEGSTIELAETEYLFTPRELVVAPGDVTFIVTNQGEIEHDFVLKDSTHHTVAEIAILEPGQSAQVAATLTEGTYAILCTLPGHLERGMTATLQVHQ